MKKSKKFVVAGLVLLAAITGLLALTGCKTDVDTSSPQQEQPGDTDNGNNDNDASVITTGDPAAFITEITAAGTYTLVATKECTDTAAIKEALGALARRQPDARIHLNLSQSGITSIGYSAFEGCSSLASVTFAEGSRLGIIGGVAFRGCTSLVSVEIPSSVTSIGYSAFEGCSSLASVTFAEGSRLGMIGDAAFRGCTSLVSVEIPTLVTSIEEAAFSRCSSLASVEIPSSVTRIVNSAFGGCSSLASVTFAEGSRLGMIGDDAFNGCRSLVSVEIPSSVTRIGNGAFGGCLKLSTVKVEAETPPALGTNVFFTHPDLKIQVPRSSEGYYTSAENWSAYKIEAITP